MKNTSYVILALMMMAVTHQINAQQMNTRLLNLEDAQKISDAAEAKARQENWNVVIAVLDAGGHLITLRRMDGTQTVSYTHLTLPTTPYV